MDTDSYKEIYHYVFSEIRNKFESGSALIFDPNITTDIDTITTILSSEEELKEEFFNLR